MDLLIAPFTVTKAQADSAPATGTPGWATDGNPATNTPATQWPAYAFNAMQEELATVIQGGGQTLNRNDNSLLFKAIQHLITQALPPGAVQYFSVKNAPDNWLKANGAAVSVATYAALAANIYCGDALNATALFGYRCTDSSNPSTTRSTTGGFIVLPDLRGEFIRGWDDGRGIDVDRVFGSWQVSMYANHSHTQQATSGTGGGLTAITFGATNAAVTSASNVPTVTSGGNETRPRNVALLACIKY